MESYQRLDQLEANLIPQGMVRSQRRNQVVSRLCDSYEIIAVPLHMVKLVAKQLLIAFIDCLALRGCLTGV